MLNKLILSKLKEGNSHDNLSFTFNTFISYFYECVIYTLEIIIEDDHILQEISTFALGVSKHAKDELSLSLGGNGESSGAEQRKSPTYRPHMFVCPEFCKWKWKKFSGPLYLFFFLVLHLLEISFVTAM